MQRNNRASERRRLEVGSISVARVSSSICETPGGSPPAVEQYFIVVVLDTVPCKLPATLPLDHREPVPYRIRA